MSADEIEKPAPRLPIVPISSAYFAIDTGDKLRHFTFILLPQFTFLAFASALDPLRIANQLSQRAIYRWSVVSEDGAEAVSSSGVSVNVDGPVAKVDRDETLFLCSGLAKFAVPSAKTAAIVRQHYQFGGRVGGICTGAIGLAHSGLLDGRTVTLHWENQPAFKEAFPQVRVSSNLSESDGRIVTCGGGSAATDMMLQFIAEDFGPEFAQVVAEMCLRDVTRPSTAQQRSSVSHQLGLRNPSLAKAITLMQTNIEDPFTITQIAEATGLSRRQLERLFLKYLNVSPRMYYRNLRIDKARVLLRETDMPAVEVAVACGFNSLDAFYRAFRERFGSTPKKYRNR